MMNVDIKWQNIDGQQWFNNKLIDLAKQYAANPNFSKFNFVISLEPNSRHIINLTINTNKKDENIDIIGNSYSLENSFEVLEKELKKEARHYDPNAKERDQLKKEKIAERIRINKEKSIELQKKKLEEKEILLKEKRAAAEREREKRLHKQNEEILKRLEKNRIEEEKEDEKILEELRQQKNEIEEAQKIEKENKEKLAKHMETLKFDVINEELKEDYEVQEKIKEDKKKLRELQSEENESLVIIEEIKDLDKRDFDIDNYIVNQPFALGDYWFYYDQEHNFFIATSEGQWAPINYDEVLNYYQLSKYNKFQELELRLIESRKRRKLHLKDLVDGTDLIKELEESKHRHKQLAKQQKEAFEKLKKDYEKTNKQSKEELKSHINPVEIDIAEIHEANEPFLTEFNVYAYHDGEGHYYLADETNNWVQVNKSDVYSKSKLTESEHKNEKQPGEQFTNLKGDLCYFDGETYYKLVENEWIPCSVAEALDLDQRKKEEKSKIFGFRKHKEKQNNKSATTNNNYENNELQNSQTQADDVVETQVNSTPVEDNTYQQETSSQAQQWTDENGTTWYLDEMGNYYWWDGNNWIPYSY